VRRATALIEVNGSRHPISLGGLVVGRGTDADLRINDPGVSRRHIEFRQSDKHVEVHDLGSTNGMLVNGQRMTSSLLDDGTVVRVGNTDIVVRIVESDV
jgi:pSer/pThr/pTyr-binding forkhead associated (FHA) protein